METKVYTSRKKYVLADGTVKYCTNTCRYTPKIKQENNNRITQKELIELLKGIKDKEILKEIRDFVQSKQPINGDVEQSKQPINGDVEQNH